MMKQASGRVLHVVRYQFSCGGFVIPARCYLRPHVLVDKQYTPRGALLLNLPVLALQTLIKTSRLVWLQVGPITVL